MNFIFIAGINRSGGSLLARLFDGHKEFSSYPMEVAFNFDKSAYSFADKITGSPTNIPDFNSQIDPLSYFDAEKEKIHVHFKTKNMDAGFCLEELNYSLPENR